MGIYSDLVSELNLLRPPHLARMVLPALEFFEPLPAFIGWMRRSHQDELVYDVGAGTGLCSARLCEAGLKVKAIDLYHREREHFRIEIADGTSFDYRPDSTVMLCRPSHGLFPVGTVDRAIDCGVRRVLYVGLSRNVENDLGKYRRRFRRVLTRAGKDGEGIYEFPN